LLLFFEVSGLRRAQSSRVSPAAGPKKAGLINEETLGQSHTVGLHISPTSLEPAESAENNFSLAAGD